MNKLLMFVYLSGLMLFSVASRFVERTFESVLCYELCVLDLFVVFMLNIDVCVFSMFFFMFFLLIFLVGCDFRCSFRWTRNFLFMFFLCVFVNVIVVGVCVIVWLGLRFLFIIVVCVCFNEFFNVILWCWMFCGF